MAFSGENRGFLSDFSVLDRCARRVTGAHQTGRGVGRGLGLGRKPTKWSAGRGGAVAGRGEGGFGADDEGGEEEGGEEEGGEDEQDAGGGADEASGHGVDSLVDAPTAARVPSGAGHSGAGV